MGDGDITDKTIARAFKQKNFYACIFYRPPRRATDIQ